MEQKVIDDLVRYKRSDTGWGYRPTRITSIIDSVHFVQSKNNVGIQIIDVVTYFINKALRLEDKILSDFKASAGLSLTDFKKANPPTQSNASVLDLYAKIAPCIVATKRF